MSKPRSALTSNRKALLLSSLTKLHSGSGITSYVPPQRGKLGAWMHNMALASAFIGSALLWMTL